MWEQFRRGARNLLSFDGWGLFVKDKRSRQLTPLYPGDTIVSERGVLTPGRDAMLIDREIQKQPGSIYDQILSSREYWLDHERMRLICDPQIEVRLNATVRPMLFLERCGFGNEIDTIVQRYLWPAIDRFWYAFLTACDIEYRKGLGELHNRHLQIIERVNALLLAEPFDMGKVVQGAVDAIVKVGNYYRAQICLVDPKREWIQAVASSCQDPNENIDFATNYRLDSAMPIEEWDCQPWVAKMRKTVVIPDGSDPNQRNPRIRSEESARLGMRAVTIVPMIIRKEVIGTVHFERARRDIPPDAEVGLYEILAGQLAAALHQAQKITLLQQSLLALPDRIRIIAPDKKLVFRNHGRRAGWQAKKNDCVCERAGETYKHPCLIDEIRGSRTCLHHYSIRARNEAGMEAEDWLIAPINDFRARLRPPFRGANPRIGYVERIHDLSELYGLYDTQQRWFAEKNVRATARQILQFFERQGFRWCRIYLVRGTQVGRRYLESLEEFGLQSVEDREKFLRGEIRFCEDSPDPQPWHVLTVARKPSIYEYKKLKHKYQIKEAQALEGLPRYSTARCRIDGSWRSSPSMSGWRRRCSWASSRSGSSRSPCCRSPCRNGGNCSEVRCSA